MGLFERVAESRRGGFYSHTTRLHLVNFGQLVHFIGTFVGQLVHFIGPFHWSISLVHFIGPFAINVDDAGPWSIHTRHTFSLLNLKACPRQETRGFFFNWSWTI